MNFLPIAALALALSLGTAAGGTPISKEAERIHRSALVIDGHNDWPHNLRRDGHASLKGIDLTESHPEYQTDIPRLVRGGLGAQFWVSFAPSQTAKEGTAARTFLEQIDLIHRLVDAYPEHLELAWNSGDIRRIHGDGRIASLIGVEGGHAIENSLCLLRTYYRLGVRYMTLTHSGSVGWADACSDEALSGGLSPFGEEVVREMNRIGMLVDISHVSVETMEDVLRVSRAPIIASHSNAYAVTPSARNVPDPVLRKVRANGGIVMVNFFTGYVHPDGAEASDGFFKVYKELMAAGEDGKEQAVAKYRMWKEAHPLPEAHIGHLVDHIDHIVKVAGIDHVGLGSDFEGVKTTPEGLEDVSCYPNVTEELLRRGYAEGDIRKILGENFMRVFAEAEAVAKRIQAEQ